MFRFLRVTSHGIRHIVVLSCVLLVLLLVSMGAVTANATDYDITNLGTLGGSYTNVKAMNDACQVVGDSKTSGGETHAFLWTQADGMEDLGTFPGGNSSYAYAINNAGQVVGKARTSPLEGSNDHAFLWTEADGMVDLGTLGGIKSIAYAINDAGQVVGYSSVNTDYPIVYHAFLWTQADGMVDLGTLGGNYAEALAINDAGQVIGESRYDTGYDKHAFFWTQDGGMVDLGTLGGTRSYVYAINDAGQVVGRSSMLEGEYHAFLWTQADGMVDLGTLGGTGSSAKFINNAGQVVGTSSTSDNDTHAFLWTEADGMVDLGTLGGTYTYPYAINDAGQVVGVSRTSEDDSHAFLWTQADGMVDLNDYITSTAPEGMVVTRAYLIACNGWIVTDTSAAGEVLLSKGSAPAAPVLGPVSVDHDPVAVGTEVSAIAEFIDIDDDCTHTADWNWGDGSDTEPGIVSEEEGSGEASGTHVFSEAGIYSISLTVTDCACLTAQVTRDIVVYDPSAGFVTGGGWIQSPPGAYKQDESLAGKANFGFVSKYKKGATVPTGNTQFRFRAADLNFHSDSYDWLVIAGARAQYKGTGTINGSGEYKFMLTAVDGEVSGGGGEDRLRMKIWYYDAELEEDVVVYDNQLDGTEETVLGGGSIVIHEN